MEWDKLKLFYTIAEVGSITKASEILHVSQGALTRSIQLLEHSAKQKLFDRNSRGVALTFAGQNLFKHVTGMMREYEAATLGIENDNTIFPKGKLEIRTNFPTAYSWLIYHVKGFMEEFPEVKLGIICDSENSYKEDGLPYVGFYLPNRSDLIQQYIKTFKYKIYGSRSYLETHGIPQSAGDLDHHRLITRSAFSHTHGCSLTKWFLDVGKKSGEIREPYFYINSAHGLFKAAVEGLGLILIGEEYPEIERATDLIEVLSQLEAPEFDIYYIYPSQMKAIKSIVEFGNYLEEKSKIKEEDNLKSLVM